jgi:hypothetical protein
VCAAIAQGNPLDPRGEIGSHAMLKGMAFAALYMSRDGRAPKVWVEVMMMMRLALILAELAGV